MELSKYITSESVEMPRSEIKLADYNPRTIPEEARKTLRRGIRKFGMVGGLVVNRQTGNTLVSGHQRLAVMDELQHYPGEDYTVRVDIVDIDERQEKELCVLMNNPNAQGQWDFDKLRELLPDIEYKDAGLTEADLNMIGVDFMLQTGGETDLMHSLEQLQAPVRERREQEKADRAEERGQTGKTREQAEDEAQQRIEHVRQMKEEVRQKAIGDAMDMDAYFMVSFDAWEAKADFLRRLGYDPLTKVIKGEVFAREVELKAAEK